MKQKYATSLCTGAVLCIALGVFTFTFPSQPAWSQTASAVDVDPDDALRRGDIEAAVIGFDRIVAAKPERMPYLWQRGIALYFAGRFDDAAEQFRRHRVVNPNDVENAAWHYLCVAKSKSTQVARQMLLPAPGDRREPMDQVLAMLTTGDTSIVEKRMVSLSASSPGTHAAEDAKFYGSFYLGLFADARGDLAEARRRMNESAKDAPQHYMGDIARVYAARLNDKPPTSDEPASDAATSVDRSVPGRPIDE